MFYLLPYASFGDYDNSTFVERANAKYFEDNFDFVSYRTYDFDVTLRALTRTTLTQSRGSV
jgi:hypothetical protein